MAKNKRQKIYSIKQHQKCLKGVILAGGFGKRLKPLTDNRPKPMIEILGKPIIDWQIKLTSKE